MDSSTIQDSSLDKKIDELDKQLMNAVEESKKYLVIKDELMNAKMEILKQKTRVRLFVFIFRQLKLKPRCDL
jgi:hypothetical protein